MNETLAILINTYLPNWITKKGGLMKIISRHESGAESKSVGRYPVSINRNKTACENGDYINLLPDGRDGAISFIQTQSTNITESFGFYDIDTVLRIVVWCNMDKINTDLVDTDLLKMAVIKAIPFRLPDNGVMCKMKTQLISAGKENVWGQFTITEEDRQFLMLPYDFFTVDYRVNYSINKACLDEIILNKTSC